MPKHFTFSLEIISPDTAAVAKIQFLGKLITPFLVTAAVKSVVK